MIFDENLDTHITLEKLVLYFLKERKRTYFSVKEIQQAVGDVYKALWLDGNKKTSAELKQLRKQIIFNQSINFDYVYNDLRHLVHNFDGEKEGYPLEERMFFLREPEACKTKADSLVYLDNLIENGTIYLGSKLEYKLCKPVEDFLLGAISENKHKQPAEDVKSK